MVGRLRTCRSLSFSYDSLAFLSLNCGVGLDSQFVFPNVDQLGSITIHGAPVHANGSAHADITAALKYNNHSSVVPCTDDIITKVYEGVRFGRFFVFPLRLVEGMKGLRLSPLVDVVAPTPKTRVIRDLTFASSLSSAGVHFSIAPACQLGHVLRKVAWRILVFSAVTWRRCTHSPQ